MTKKYSIPYDVNANVFVDPDGQRYVSFGIGLEADREDTEAIAEAYELGMTYEDHIKGNRLLVSETEQYTDLKDTGETYLIKADSDFTVDKVVTDSRTDLLHIIAGLNVHELMKV